MILRDDIQEALDRDRAPSADVTSQWLDEWRVVGPLLEDLHAQAMKRKTIKCPACSKRTQIGNIRVTDVYRHIPAYNSFDDPYDMIERTVCQCPKCDESLLLHRYEGTQHDRYNQFPLKKFFKSVTEEKEGA